MFWTFKPRDACRTHADVIAVCRSPIEKPPALRAERFEVLGEPGVRGVDVWFRLLADEASHFSPVRSDSTTGHVTQSGYANQQFSGFSSQPKSRIQGQITQDVELASQQCLPTC